MAMMVQALEVSGLKGKALNAKGRYLRTERLREGLVVYAQEEGDTRGHELSHDGGAWTVALTEDQRKCWAFAETMEPDPWRVPRESWQIYDGKNWVPAPPEFAVTEARSDRAAQRSLPAGYETKVSRTTGQVYYFNTAVRTARRQPPTRHCPRASRSGKLCS